MPLLEWKAEYSVNISEIDEQHRKLIDLVNRLYDAMKVGQGKTVMAAILGELVQYIAYHFATEERLFREHRYPDAALHAALTAQAKDLQARYGHQPGSLSVETMRFLRDWLNHHILGSDRKYGPFLNERGVR